MNGRGDQPSSSSQSDATTDHIVVTFINPDGTENRIPFSIKPGTPVEIDVLDSNMSPAATNLYGTSQSVEVISKKRGRRNRSNSLLTPAAKTPSSQGTIGSLIEQLGKISPQLGLESLDSDMDPTVFSMTPNQSETDEPITRQKSKLRPTASSMIEFPFPHWSDESSDEENQPPRRRKHHKKDKGADSPSDTIIEMGTLTTNENSLDSNFGNTTSGGIQLRAEDEDGSILAAKLTRARETWQRSGTTGEAHPDQDDDTPSITPLLSSSTADYVAISIDTETPVSNKLESLHSVRMHLAQQPESVFKKTIINPFISIGQYIGNNWVFLLIGGLTAIPGAINAFCNPTGIDPKNLVTAVQLMSFEQLMSSLWSMWSNLAPNAVMNCEFFVNLKKDFKKVKDVWQSGIAGKLSIVAAVVTGVSAALAAGSIGYSAFLFLPAGEVTALIPAALNATITFISRFNGLLNLINQVKAMQALRHDKGAHMKNMMANEISHLSEKCQAHFNQFLGRRAIDETTAESLFIAIEKLKAKKTLFATLSNLLSNQGKITLGHTDFDIDDALSILRQHIEKLLISDESETLEKLIGSIIPVTTLRQVALLKQAFDTWMNEYQKDGDTRKWAELAHDTAQLHHSGVIDADHFADLQQNLVRHLSQFAKDHAIDLRELAGSTLSTNNIDTFVFDINRLMDKLMLALKAEVQHLQHLALLKETKNSWMIERANHISHTDAQQDTSQQAGELIEHLNEICLQQQIKIKDIIPADHITTDNLDSLLRTIDLITNQHENVVDAPSLAEQFSVFGRNTWLVGKIGFAALGAFYIAQIFDFKGFQGLNLLVKQVSQLLHRGFGVEVTDFNNWSATNKMLAGALPAAATSLFYFKHVFDFLDSIMEKYLFRLAAHPAEIPFAAIMLLHTYYSGGSMRNIANNIANTPNNFIGMQAGDLYTQFQIEFNFYLATTVNTKILAGLVLNKSNEETSPRPAQTTAGVAAYLRDLKTTTDSFVKNLSTLSFFSSINSTKTTLRETDVYNHNTGPGLL